MLSKNNGKPYSIEDIIIADIDKLNSELKGRFIGHNRSRIIRNHAGGTCIKCQNLPNYKISFDPGDGFKRVEFWCKKCYDRWVVEK